MKSLINLENTGFNLEQAFQGLADAWPKVRHLAKGRLTLVPDFGTVFIGLDKVTDPEKRQWLWDLAAGEGPVFTAPDDWRWPQVAKALGFFKSTSEARRNGWDEDFQLGWNERLGRIHKAKGLVVVFKVRDGF